MQWNSLLILMKNYDDIQLTVNGFLPFLPPPTVCGRIKIDAKSHITQASTTNMH